VTGNTACALTFVTLLVPTPAQYRDAFLTLISSPATEALFFATYDEARLERFRFDAAMVDFWYANLPAAVAACTGTRCADWTTFILARLYDGRMYSCPSLTGLSASALLGIIPYGDFYCTDSVAAALAPLATTPTITSLLSTLTTHARPWSRRNAIRIIGRFGERPVGDPSRTLVVTTNATAVTQAAHQCLMVDTATNVLNDCIWVLDSFFYPFLPMQPALEAIAMGNTYDMTTRFRAAAAISRLINSKSGLLSAGDQAYLTNALSASDEWVRAQAAFTVETMPAAKLNPTIQSALSTALTNAYAVEQVLNPKVFMARALDRLNGTSLTAQLRASYEAQHLGSTASASGYTIRSGLDAGVLPSFLSFMTNEAAAFHDILGPAFTTPVPNDPNPGMTLLLFATRARYQEYMDAFVGFGSQAGGLYLESIGTLYTYERTPAQSVYTVRELIQHEFGHYLQGRFVFPGLWTDPGYHAQPKGWADEGFAEVLGGLSFDGGSYFIHGRPQHVSAICQATPFTTIDALTTRRIGYDQAGTFDYTNGWGLNFWLFTSERPRGRALFSALRSGSYTQSTWASVAGYPSISAAQTAWYSVLGSWCTNGGPPGPSGAPAPSIPPFLVPFVPVNDSVCRDVERLLELPAARPPRGPPTQ
jgi:hypothetical protein